jgi:hypothetical protein
MHDLQAWIYHTLAASSRGAYWATTWVKPFMISKWGWPFCETVHFLGLSLLMGTIGMFDLRLLGMGKRVPLGALHKLIPWGVAGYIITAMTGVMFLATEPDQYIFNAAFHFKILFMLLAGVNVATFYLALFRRVKRVGSGEDAELPARMIGAMSLILWTGVIVFGRMLTFYRPVDCSSESAAFISTCIPLH